MVPRGPMRQMFPGGNTSRGFTSFFEWIAPPDGYTFVLKGGPGTGKSTFMKRLAAQVQSQGIGAEFHHCSADPDSVDAVAFPELKVAVVDGTAPHPVEPALYEVSGEIVDLGPYCHRAALRRQRPRIAQLAQDAGRAFQRAYRYLAAARAVRDDWAAANRARRDEVRRGRWTAELVKAVLDGPVADHGPALPPTQTVPFPWPPGAVRRLFATSITPDGPRHHLESVLQGMSRIFVVHGEPGSGRSQLIQAVADGARAQGWAVELFHCAFDPENVDHVRIPSLSAAVVSSTPPHQYPSPSTPADGHLRPARQRVVDLNDLLPFEPTKSTHPAYRGEPVAVAAARPQFWQLVRQGVDALRQAKQAHLALEAGYVPHIDFSGVEQRRQEVLRRILQMASARPQHR